MKSKIKKFLKTKWRDIALILLLLNLIIGTAIPALADVIHIQSLTTGLWETDGSETQLISATDVDFQKYMAIALACDNGATLPASANEGQWFLHTPTGRNILYQYDGSNWGAIMSIGSMTVYVDSSDGTDSLAYGTGVDSDAFATVQYAVDCIPGCFMGNVIINVNDENYAEDVVIRGKSPTGNYVITIQGTLTVDSSGTQSANGVTGTGATQGSFTDTGNLAGVADLLCYLDSDGDYRIVDSTDGNTATICGTFTSQPLQNENYVIYDWGTSIDSIQQISPCTVLLYDLELTGTGTWRCFGSGESSATTNVYRCKFGVRPYIQRSTVNVLYCLLDTTTGNAQFDVGYSSLVVIQYSKLKFTNNSAYGQVYNGATLVFRYGSIVDGYVDGVNKANYGWSVYNSGSILIQNNVNPGYTRYRNCDTALYAYNGGMVVGTTNNQYLNNGTNENADDGALGISFGYID